MHTHIYTSAACIYAKAHTYAYKQHCTHAQIANSYLPVIGVHEMHGRMHSNYWQITILLVVDLCSSLAYFMMIQSFPIAGKLPIKTLVAKQPPTNFFNMHTIDTYSDTDNI